MRHAFSLATIQYQFFWTEILYSFLSYTVFSVHGWNMDPSLHIWDDGTVKTMDWKERIASKKAKTVLSADKVMASVFSDARGIIFIDYLQKEKTINGEYYANSLQCLSDEIKKNSISRKRKFYYIKAMNQFTHPLSWWPKSMS